nr:unnamed protein product [Spirometra erinaceieuropaei]
MGNAAPSLQPSPDCEAYRKVPGDPAFNSSCIDPRSPTDGIIRTPIVIVNSSGDTASNQLFPFDISDFETIDGVETEDDSLHRNVDTSALSDTVASGASNIKTKGPLSRFRHSLMAYRGRNSLLHDSPSLFVRLRQKLWVENKREQFAEQLRHTDKESSCAVQD